MVEVTVVEGDVFAVSEREKRTAERGVSALQRKSFNGEIPRAFPRKKNAGIGFQFCRAFLFGTERDAEILQIVIFCLHFYGFVYRMRAAAENDGNICARTGAENFCQRFHCTSEGGNGSISVCSVYTVAARLRVDIDFDSGGVGLLFGNTRTAGVATRRANDFFRFGGKFVGANVTEDVAHNDVIRTAFTVGPVNAFRRLVRIIHNVEAFDKAVYAATDNEGCRRGISFASDDDVVVVVPMRRALIVIEGTVADVGLPRQSGRHHIVMMDLVQKFGIFLIRVTAEGVDRSAVFHTEHKVFDVVIRDLYVGKVQIFTEGPGGDRPTPTHRDGGVATV